MSALGAAQIAAVTLLGRALLACLPPGSPGSHVPRDLPATWAASHVLGMLAALAAAALVGPISADSIAFWTAIGGAGALVAAVNIALGPGALVPRHEPVREPASALVQIVRLAAIASVVAAAWRARTGPGDMAIALAAGSPRLSLAVQALDGLALVALVEHGLERARCAPWMRACASLVAAAVVALDGFADASGWSLLVSAAFVLGVTSTVAWLRRADARALSLASIGFGGAALAHVHGIVAGALGVVAMLHGTAPASRRKALLVAAGALAIGALAGTAIRQDENTPAELAPAHRVVGCALLVLLCAAPAVSIAIDARRGRSPLDAGSGASDRADETTALFCGVGLAGVQYVARLDAGAGQRWLDLSPALAACVALLVGMALKRVRSFA